MKITERGWAGHFIGGNECRFRRNTLIDNGKVKIVVSTVGLYQPTPDGKFEPLGANNRMFETMVFYSDPKDTRYHDADVKKEVQFESPWFICDEDADDKANEMHDAVVKEIAKKFQNKT